MTSGLEPNPTLYLPYDSYEVPSAVANESPDEFDSRILAAYSHRSQKRKYTGEPYIRHPKAVVELVRSTPGHTTEMLCIAWLHDTVEDTDLTLEEIGNYFHCLSIMEGVQALTGVPPGKGLNRKARKASDADRLSKAPAQIQTIKLADLIDNSSSIMEHDPEFAKNYLTEKRALLDVLNKGDTTLWRRANEICLKAGY